MSNDEQFLKLTGLTKNQGNHALARFLSSRGFDLSHEIEGGECFSVEADGSELRYYFGFPGGASNNVLKTGPLFTDSLDSMALITDAMTPAERYTNWIHLSDLTDRDNQPRTELADASTRAIAAILALNLGEGETT